MRLKGLLLRRFAVRQNVTVGPRFHVGPNSRVWAPRSLVIGADVYIGKNATIEVDGSIGDGVLIANNVGLVGRRDHDATQTRVLISRAAWVGDDPSRLSLDTVIEADVWIGFGAIVLSGVTIGRSAIVAAGAVVTGDVRSNAVVAGNPAREVSRRFEPEALALHWRSLGLDDHHGDVA